MEWKTENAPKDGQPIVAVGRIVESGPDGGYSDPFCTAIFWNKTEGGFEGWCLWIDEYHLSVANHPDTLVAIDFWLPYPAK